MFHQGDLQSGIAAAIHWQKFVACFISDDEQLSRDWEDMVFRAPNLSPQFDKYTVLLKIRLGSPEAEFLSAFYRVTAAPALVIIQNGQVLEHYGTEVQPDALHFGMASFFNYLDVTGWETSQTRFQMNPYAASRAASNQALLNAALAMRTAPATTAQTPDTTGQPPQAVDTSASTEPAVAVPPAAESVTVDHSPAEPTVTPQSSAQPESTAPVITKSETIAQAATAPTQAAQRPTQPDSEAQSEEERLAQEASAKAARVAAAEARRLELEAAQSSTNKGKQRADDNTSLPPKARVDYMQLQTKRKQELKAERERILARIQADRENRKAKASSPSLNVAAEPIRRQATTGSPASGCAVQIRLVDGSSMKRHFTADQTLKDVRNWIKDTASEDSITKSYTFRQLLVPQPSRAIDVADEVQSLRELGLTPSVTLIVSPAEEASGGSTNNNVFMRIMATLLGIISTLVAWMSSLGGQLRPATDAASSKPSLGNASGVEDATSTVRLRTRTLADSRAEKADDEPTQYYNGNSSAFEGRKDDDEK